MVWPCDTLVWLAVLHVLESSAVFCPKSMSSNYKRTPERPGCRHHNAAPVPTRTYHIYHLCYPVSRSDFRNTCGHNISTPGTVENVPCSEIPFPWNISVPRIRTTPWYPVMVAILCPASLKSPVGCQTSWMLSGWVHQRKQLLPRYAYTVGTVSARHFLFLGDWTA